MHTFSIPAKRATHLPQIDLIEDTVLRVVVIEEAGEHHTHQIQFFDGNALVDIAYIYIYIPCVITPESFVQMWTHLLLDRSGENTDPRRNAKTLRNGGRVKTPVNLGYTSLVIIGHPQKVEWSLTADHLVWVERKNGQLPMIRKNGVRLIKTQWPVKDLWTNFGITQDHLCIELWNDRLERLARYCCPFNDVLTKEQVSKIQLDVPLGVDVFDHLLSDWDEREKFRLVCCRVGPLLFISSLDGEVQAMASATTFTPKGLHVAKAMYEELSKTNPHTAEAFRDAASDIIFKRNVPDTMSEQQLLSLCFEASHVKRIGGM